MTQIEAIQMNIHKIKLDLNKARKLKSDDYLEKMTIDSTIENYLQLLTNLRYSLAQAILQESK
jgi:hypothetical protein